MKPSLLALGVSMWVVAASAFAQAADKPTPELTFTGNAGLFTDYRFRGFTQTNYKPAFQGGFDLAHKSGFYLGNWNSNVEQSLYTGASLEMDVYGGYKGSLGDLGYDVGVLHYAYPGSGDGGSTKVRNTEFYVGGTYGPASLKYFHSTSNFFSLGAGTGISTKGSGYLDLSASVDLGDGWGVNGHVGWQKVRNLKRLGAGDDQVIDYKLGVTRDLDGWLLGAAVVATDGKDFFLTGNGTAGGKTRAVLSLSRTF